MQYYTVEDVKRLTGKSQNKSYEIIRNLNKQFKKKYPESVPIQGQVMKWYFEEAMGVKGSEQNEAEKVSVETIS